ncbi:MAG: O-antigen ligase family protein [Chloroflexi bacterium]|nr:O-antigen ligase family protein [Chloroflexota bacterium]
MGAGLTARRHSPAWLGDGLYVLEWALTLAAIGLWASGKIYVPLMNAGSVLLVGAWTLRWAHTRRPFPVTPIDLPLVLFMLSAAVGLWAMPNWWEALTRLYLYLGAVGLFYLLAECSPRALARFSAGFVAFAATLSLYFVTQNDWANQPVKFAAVRALGLALNRLVPDLGQYKPHPNVVASVLALVLPVALMLALQSWRSRAMADRLTTLIAVGGGLVVLFGVGMTASRGAWLALAGAAALALWWWLASRASPRFAAPQPAVFWGGIALVALAASIVFIVRPQLITTIFGALPGFSSAVSRLEVYQQSWRLVQDAPFTGGGLAAFPALYSTYILVIPQSFITHAHNAFLNVLVEQGWPGLGGFAGLMALAAWRATTQLRAAPDAYRPFVIAGALGIGIMILHGLSDAALIVSRMAPAMLIPAGLCLAGAAQSAGARVGAQGLAPLPAPQPWRRRLALGAVALAALLLMVVWRPALTAWHANMAAVAEARVELYGFPTNEWNDGQYADYLAPAESEARRALALDPGNRTANQRLGLAAMLRRNFGEAAQYLQQAHTADPDHHGVTKALAYSYVWLGEYDRAAPLLASIPEARTELGIYVWWWQAQGYPELSERAHATYQRLEP